MPAERRSGSQKSSQYLSESNRDSLGRMQVLKHQFEQTCKDSIIFKAKVKAARRKKKVASETLLKDEIKGNKVIQSSKVDFQILCQASEFFKNLPNNKAQSQKNKERQSNLSS